MSAVSGFCIILISYPIWVSIPFSIQRCILCGFLVVVPQVTGIPTVLAVRNGKVVNKFTGLIETKELREFVEQLLS